MIYFSSTFKTTKSILLQVRVVVKGLLILWLINFLLASAADNVDDLLTEFKDTLSSYQYLLDELSLEVAAHKQWLQEYKLQMIPSELVIAQENSINEHLNEILKKIEVIERSTSSGWINALSEQLDSYALTQVPPEEIISWMDSQKQYVDKIQTDFMILEQSIKQIKQTYLKETSNYPVSSLNHPPINKALALDERGGALSSSTTSKPQESSSDSVVVTQSINVEESLSYAGTLEHIYNPIEINEYDALEASLLYLLGGLEMWGEWLDPANEVGLLPEAEGRFMTSSTPILQAGGTSISGSGGYRGSGFCSTYYY